MHPLSAVPLLVGLALFSRGFLLSRQTLPFHAEAQENAPPRLASRLVLVLLDALRFDFCTPTHASSPYRNHLPIIQELLSSNTENATYAHLFHFVADPPTTTLQRIQALSSGTLPTFLDMSSNFNANNATEDTWVSQFGKAGLKTVFLGDDTWLGMYPHVNGSTPWWVAEGFPSFNVWDLDTLDDDVMARLPRFLPSISNLPLFDKTRRVDPAGTDTDWDVMVVHLLGVDHAGHRYGPAHSEMTRKLIQMNLFLTRLVDAIRRQEEEDGKRSMLMVFGDHGMDRKGDHGGESQDETGAALFAFAPRGWRPINPLLVEEPDAWVSDMGVRWRSIPQIDLVPTISQLMGVPIPFSSLGWIIPEMFTSEPYSPALESDLLQISGYALNNVRQITTYVDAYARAFGDFDAGFLAELRYMYENIMETEENSKATLSQAELVDTYRKLRGFTRTVLHQCREVWAKFDVVSMWWGIVMVTLSLLDSITCFNVGAPIIDKLTLGSVAIGGLVGYSVEIVAKYQALSVLVASIFGVLIFRILAIGVLRMTRFSWRQNTSSLNVLALGLLVVHSLCFASNSFVVFEDRIVLGLLQMPTLLMIWTAWRIAGTSSTDGNMSVRGRETQCAQASQSAPRLAFFALLHGAMVRLTAIMTVCREEQGFWCQPTFYSHAESSTSADWHLVVLGLLPILLPWLIWRLAYKDSMNWHGVARIWTKIVLPFALVVMTGYWILDERADIISDRFSNSQWVSTTKLILVRVGFGLAAIVGPYMWWQQPLCLEVSVKEVVNPSNSSVAEKALVILGYGNAYGAPYVTLVTMFALIVMLTQLPPGVIVVAIATVHIIVLLEAFDAWRDVLFQKTKPSQENAWSVTNCASPIQVVTMALLAHHYFFASGHQATLSSLQWRAAFIGVQDANFLVSPILMTLNTVGCIALFSLAVPLLSVYKVSPSADSRLWSNIASNTMLWIVYWSVIMVSSMFWAGFFRRHLMVWKVWAPRFMLSGISAPLVMMFTFLGRYAIVPRIRREAERILQFKHDTVNN